MKERDYIRLMDLADDKYILEADPDAELAGRRAVPGRRAERGTAHAKKGTGSASRRRAIKYSAIAAGIAVCIAAGGLGLFLPYEDGVYDTSAYEGSEYYALISKMNEYVYGEPKSTNNFNKIMEAISGSDKDYSASPDFGGASGGDAPDGGGEESPDGSGGSQGESYEEVTDNQTEGVTEGDLIKRSDRYIYYLDGNELEVFAIDGKNSQMVGSYEFVSMDDGANYRNYAADEFYLSEDCLTVTVVGTYYDNAYGYFTSVISLDVTDPQNIEETHRVAVSGTYSSSRVKDGKLLLATQYSASFGRADYSDPSTFVPQQDTGEGLEPLPSEGIVSPDKLTSSRFTVVTQYDVATLEAKGAAAYLCYAGDFYASSERLYFTRSYTEAREEGGCYVRSAMTEISCLNYGGDEFAFEGSATIEGKVLNRYSMDEYKGVLRVFTTTRRIEYSGGAYIGISGGEKLNASLYCIDISDWSVVGSVENFAPEGESVRSARFDGDTAYVCTAVEITDPVFFFYLSDPENITYRQTAVISGFSTSLIDFGDGCAVGIGSDGEYALKIEAYVPGDTGIVPLCAYRADVYYSSDYKAYYIDRENGFIGLGITDYSYGAEARSRYILLYFDGESFTEVINTPLAGAADCKRGVYVDGYFYMFGSDDFKVAKIG